MLFVTRGVFWKVRFRTKEAGKQQIIFHIQNSFHLISSVRYGYVSSHPYVTARLCFLDTVS